MKGQSAESGVSGFRVSGFRFEDLVSWHVQTGFRFEDLGFRFEDLGFRFEDLVSWHVQTGGTASRLCVSRGAMSDRVSGYWCLRSGQM